MSRSVHPAIFRLVGCGDDASRSQWAAGEQARLAVVKENRLAAHASGLDPRDPRWVLAMQTRARLQGAVLTPERRDELLDNGRRLGLRPFEANLVIAIVQDQARQAAAPAGFAAGAAQTLDSSPVQQLGQGRLTPKRASRRRAGQAAWPRWVAAMAAAAAVATVIARWVIG